MQAVDSVLIQARASILLVVLALSVSTAYAHPVTSSKSKKATVSYKHGLRNNRVIARGHYFVPPPPPDTPPMLSQSQYGYNGVSQQTTSKTENPYRKYVYTRDGYTPPQGFQPNKYVTYWNKS